MKAHIITGLILVAGFINFAPLIGVISRSRLTKLYSLDFSDPALELLMRHRAVLFGIVGGFMIFAAFNAQWQKHAIIMGLISMVSFLVLARLIPGSANNLGSIIWAEIMGILCLVGASILMWK